MLSRAATLAVIVLSLQAGCAFTQTRGGARQASFAELDRRARAGERLSVVFYGASLTWGANATDPPLTSYRGQVADRFRSRYPKARFRFWDGAIGGTGSQLGVFRLDRDCFGRRPDLVFLDFSANDDIYSADPETLASYEAIVRRLVQAGMPVVIVVFPFQWNVQQGNTDGMKGRDAHLAIAKAYGVPVGDAVVLAQHRVAAKAITIPEFWPTDGVHPGNRGYGIFADAAWDAYRDAVKRAVVCKAPTKMMHADTYMTSARVRISLLGELPQGWRVGAPSLVSAWFDALMSRWLDDEVIASSHGDAVDPKTKKKTRVLQKVEPLRARFRGSMLMLFGEKTVKSCAFRVLVDGQVIEHQHPRTKKMVKEFEGSAKQFGGNTHLSQVVTTGLDPKVEHTLEIVPAFEGGAEQELRLESLCVAGAGARVWRTE